MQATRDSEIIPVGEAREMDFIPSWYRTAQAADSMLAYDDEHPLRDASLEMLGRVILLSITVASLAMVAFLWWLV